MLKFLTQSFYVLATFIFCLVLGTPSSSHAFFKEFGISDEKKLREELEVLVKSRLPIIEDPEVRSYIEDLTQHIVDQAPPQPFEFESSVVYSPMMNAFASPGGFLVVFSGLLIKMDRESQLAGVMAHEVAHATQRHIANRINRDKYINIASLVGMLGAAFAGGGEGTSAIMGASLAAGQSAMLNYSRLDEDDADKFGLQYLVKAGYRPAGLMEAFQIMQNESFGIGRDFPSYLSTHPDINSRITALRTHIQAMPAEIVNRTEDNTRFLRVKALVMAYYADARIARDYFLNPKTAIDFMGRGITESRAGHRVDAEKYFKQAIKLNNQDSLILRETGRFYYDLGKSSEAYKYLLQAIQRNPNDFMAIFFYARLLDADGRYKEAEQEYLKVLKYAPEDSEVHNLYGHSLGRSGDTFKGYLHLALASLYKNDVRRARTWLKRAEKIAHSDRQKAELEHVNALFSKRMKYLK